MTSLSEVFWCILHLPIYNRETGNLDEQTQVNIILFDFQDNINFYCFLNIFHKIGLNRF